MIADTDLTDEDLALIEKIEALPREYRPAVSRLLWAIENGLSEDRTRARFMEEVARVKRRRRDP